MMKTDLSVYQIIVLCGDHEIRHTERLADLANKNINTISTWSTRGVPMHQWKLCMELSGVDLDQMVNAHTHLLGLDDCKMRQRYGRHLKRCGTLLDPFDNSVA